MDQSKRAVADFELTELKMKIGEMFNKFIAGDDVPSQEQSVYVKTLDASDFKYRLQRTTDLLFEMLCYQFATLKVNGASINEEAIDDLVDSIVSNSEEMYQEMVKEKLECLNQMS